MNTQPLRRTAGLLGLVLAASACQEIAAPRLGGQYAAVLDSPYSTEGAALFQVDGTGLRSLSATGRILIARPVAGDSVRVLIMSNPTRLVGGAMTFTATMDEGVAPPGGRVLAVAAGGNRPRRILTDYILRYTRAQEAGAVDNVAAAPGGPSLAGANAEIGWNRMLDALFPDPAQPLTEAEMNSLNLNGNTLDGFDLGDVRAYLQRNPEQIPTVSSWTR